MDHVVRRLADPSNGLDLTGEWKAILPEFLAPNSQYPRGCFQVCPSLRFRIHEIMELSHPTCWRDRKIEGSKVTARHFLAVRAIEREVAPDMIAGWSVH